MSLVEWVSLFCQQNPKYSVRLVVWGWVARFWDQRQVGIVSRILNHSQQYVPLTAFFFRSVEPARTQTQPRHLSAVAARIIFLGWAGFEKFDFFSGCGVWNSLASSGYWLLFLEPTNYFDGQFLPTMCIFTFFAPI